MDEDGTVSKRMVETTGRSFGRMVARVGTGLLLLLLVAEGAVVLPKEEAEGALWSDPVSSSPGRHLSARRVVGADRDFAASAAGEGAVVTEDGSSLHEFPPRRKTSTTEEDGIMVTEDGSSTHEFMTPRRVNNKYTKKTSKPPATNSPATKPPTKGPAGNGESLCVAPSTDDIFTGYSIATSAGQGNPFETCYKYGNENEYCWSMSYLSTGDSLNFQCIPNPPLVQWSYIASVTYNSCGPPCQGPFQGNGESLCVAPSKDAIFTGYSIATSAGQGDPFETCYKYGNENEYCWSQSYYDDEDGRFFQCIPNPPSVQWNYVASVTYNSCGPPCQGPFQD